jgi:hypothetical protein
MLKIMKTPEKMGSLAQKLKEMLTKGKDNSNL